MNWICVTLMQYLVTGCDDGPGLCAHMLTALSLLLIAVSLPLSLFMVVKVVQVVTVGMTRPDIVIQSLQGI